MALCLGMDIQGGIQLPECRYPVLKCLRHLCGGSRVARYSIDVSCVSEVSCRNKRRDYKAPRVVLEANYQVSKEYRSQMKIFTCISMQKWHSGIFACLPQFHLPPQKGRGLVQVSGSRLSGSPSRLGSPRVFWRALNDSLQVLKLLPVCLYVVQFLLCAMEYTADAVYILFYCIQLTKPNCLFMVK